MSTSSEASAKQQPPTSTSGATATDASNLAAATVAVVGSKVLMNAIHSDASTNTPTSTNVLPTTTTTATSTTTLTTNTKSMDENNETTNTTTNNLPPSPQMIIADNNIKAAAAAADIRHHHQGNNGQQLPASSNSNAPVDNWLERSKPPLNKNRYKTEDVTKIRGTAFEDFFLKKELLMGIYDMGFEHPSPIQEEAIPMALIGKNIIARAKNGTGKTAAFVIPILEKISTASKVTQALILVPTRELAMQTSHVVKSLGAHMRVQSMVSTGGTSLTDDILRLYNPVHVLVATPGRVLDLMSRGICHLQESNPTVVFDEADKLLSMEFSPVCEELMKLLPQNRQLMMFSATFPVRVVSFKERWLPKAHEINLMEELTLKGVAQFYAYVEERQKVQCLNALFSRLQINQCIIFCNSVTRVELLAKKITELGYSCFYIHARMQQQHRNRVFHDFRSGNCRCLVSSDLCTRGVDVQTVNCVINFDLCRTAESHLHRVGRTGRFGHRGICVSFVTESDRYNLYRIEQELGIEIKPIPSFVDPALYT